MSAPILQDFTASSHTHIGTLPPGYHGRWKETHTVHYHGFESLSTERGVFAWSPEFMLLGNPWILELYPGGDDDAAEGMISLYLKNKSNKAIEINFLTVSLMTLDRKCHTVDQTLHNVLILWALPPTPEG